jgi:RHS repeat-associated protein
LIAASTALNVPGAPVLASYAYGYDKASNLVSVNGNGVIRNFDVNATNALSAASYDANGNPLKLGAATYDWDAANRLVRHAVNNTDSSFVYDGQSRLVRIVDRQEGVVVADKSYLWCGLERCLERDNMKVGAPVSKRYFAQGVLQDGVGYRHVADSLGSVRQLVDATGRTRARYDYEPYGGRRKIDGDVDADFAFAGLFGHGPSGLNLAVYRGYDSQRGRWLNRDGAGEAGGFNLYGYVGQNPTSYIDPSGLIRLPNDPNGLPSGWSPDPSHRHPDGERYKNPDGETLDFHPETPGAPGYGGKDHWHWSGRPKWHYKPGDQCPTSDTLPEDARPAERSPLPNMPAWLPLILLIPFPGNPIYGGL